MVEDKRSKTRIEKQLNVKACMADGKQVQNESRHTLASFHIWEENHARLLGRLNEEIEEKRRQLSAKIIQEHERQIRQLEGDLDCLARDCEALEAQLRGEKEKFRHKNKGLELSLEEILRNHEARIADLQSKHEGRLAALRSSTDNLHHLRQEVQRAEAITEAKAKALSTTSRGDDKAVAASSPPSQQGKWTENSLRSLLHDTKASVEKRKKAMEREEQQLCNEVKEKTQVLHDEHRQELQERDVALARLRDLSATHERRMVQQQKEIADLAKQQQQQGSSGGGGSGLRPYAHRAQLEEEILGLREQLAASYDNESTDIEASAGQAVRALGKMQARLQLQKKGHYQEKEGLGCKLALVDHRLNELEKAKSSEGKSFEVKKRRLQNDLKAVQENQEAYKAQDKDKEDPGAKVKRLTKMRLEEKEKQLQNKIKVLNGRISDSISRHGASKEKLTGLIRESHQRLEEGISYLGDRDEKDLQRIAELQGQIRDALRRCQTSRDLSEALKNDHLVRATLEHKKHMSNMSCYKKEVAEKLAEIKKLKWLAGDVSLEGEEAPLDREHVRAPRRESEVLQEKVSNIVESNRVLENQVQKIGELAQYQKVKIGQLAQNETRKADDKAKVWDIFERERDAFYEQATELNERIRKAIDERDALTVEFEEKLARMMKRADGQDQGFRDHLAQRRSKLVSQVSQLTQDLGDLQEKMQSAKEVHKEHIRKAIEKHQLAVHPYNKRRKANTLTHGEAVPKIALYARDQLVDAANDNENRKKLKSLEKSNKKLENLNTLLEAKERLLRAQSDGQQRRIEGTNARQGRHSSEGDEMRHSMEKSKEEKDTEIKELEARKQDLKDTNLALRKKKDSLLHKKYPRC